MNQALYPVTSFTYWLREVNKMLTSPQLVSNDIRTSTTGPLDHRNCSLGHYDMLLDVGPFVEESERALSILQRWLLCTQFLMTNVLG